MPLVRFELRNEYALGQPELYKDANPEDPKAVLDGVAVAGLVGILRQLGDLAEFASEVFHGLQEQLTITASRSQKLKLRVQNIEAALPPIEKAILAQNSHIHFAYTAGSEWHPRIQNEQNHFIYNDLPRFIMDSYEECRDPPRFHLLDKFDIGGPGSCLKRYSDPTFFRRASGGFKEPDPEKVHRDKKARKAKKKRSQRRKATSLQNGSISSHSDRSQFFQPTVNGRTSSSHTASTIDLPLKSDLNDHSNSSDSRNGSNGIECDLPLKSDLNDHSNSSDSRNGSNGIECVFRPSSSVQPEEQKCNGFSLKSFQDDDTRDSAFSEDQKFNGFSSRSFQGDEVRNSGFSDEQRGIAVDSFLHFSSPEQIQQRSSGAVDDSSVRDSSPELIPLSSSYGTWKENQELKKPEAPDGSSLPGSSPELLPPSFSFVTWDEKEEIPEPKSQHLDEDEAPNILAVHSVMDVLESETVTEIQNPENVTVEEENVRGPSSTVTMLDEVESETDSFMDALNTIDTESENDLDYQTKHEVRQVESAFDDGRTDHEHDGDVDVGTSGRHSQHDHLILPETSSNNGLVSDVSPAKEQILDDSSELLSSSASDSESGILASTIVNAPDDLKLESQLLDRSFKIAVKEVKESVADVVLDNSGKPQESSNIEFSHLEPIKIWTNGGLLGLQPSKPPDFNMANPDSQSSEAYRTQVVNSPMPSNDSATKKPSILVKDGESTERIPLHDEAKAKDASNPVTPGNGLPLGAYIKFTTGEPSHETEGYPSQKIFGLGQRLLANGLGRKISLAPSSEPEPGSYSSPQPAEIEKKCRQPLVKFRESPPNNYLTASPPLEHMKISFQPTDRAEASKLRLKFPDGNYSNDSTTDLFPSFQLVPEAATGRDNVVYDSDDDTFCRSSPYLSEDCLSHHSGSDSDQWEAGQSPESIHDGQPVEPVQSPMKLREMETNGLSASVLDLPSFDAVELPLDESRQNGVSITKESSPLPPPLPPAQWWVSKESNPTSDPIESKPQASSDAPQISLVPKLVAPPATQQPKPAPATEQEAHQVIVPFTPKRKEEPKLNCQKETNQPANRKVMHEQEDFLHQIRSKSFSLKPTAPAKMAVAGATANGTVTEILKKANAIRQVVASDMEDDDAWSDP